jgi:hypothetical protein
MCGPARRESKAFKDLPPVQWGEVFHADAGNVAVLGMIVVARPMYQVGWHHRDEIAVLLSAITRFARECRSRPGLSLSG